MATVTSVTIQFLQMYYRRLIIGFQTGTYAIRYRYVNSTFITLDFGVVVPSSRESWSKVGVSPNQFYPTGDFTMEIVYELRGSSTPSSGGILIDDIEVTNSKEDTEVVTFNGSLLTTYNANDRFNKKSNMLQVI
ncbi:uncharacterized protein TRIADDRAFT_60924 [Trichoplax adhaerens]|uniref:Uncharacterized protein n=1 Tax=Trichoplax adhaerens TaxID=10228 RepID=B3S9I8_TRIAD|nr:predicted protein [Trichoplax adhaerens]EDV20707.1 predicted protein [Trichoplax adhaerens]|eukprot:XP_002116907.1 predicted protein [Trichoplax adhaerens]